MKRYVVCIAALAMSGCSAGVDGFHQNVRFDSAPAGAAVSVVRVGDTETMKVTSFPQRCVTPCSLMILRDPTYVATFTKQGCSPAKLRLEPYRNGLFFAPLLPDEWTGGTYDFKPNPMVAQLACATAAGA